MFIAANTREPATASSMFELEEYFEMVAIFFLFLKMHRCAGFSQSRSLIIMNTYHDHLYKHPVVKGLDQGLVISD